VSALRRKLGDDPAAPRYIHTVRGVGFRFDFDAP
jgi:DNA-binding response OmpR family regulator